MRRDADTAIFWLTAASAAATLISIAAMGTLLAAAVLLWIVARPAPIKWPSYFLPLAAFMATTVLSLAMSPEPAVGRHAIQKFVLFSMGLLAAAFVTSETRAEKAQKLLLSAAAVSGGVAIVQFVLGEMTYLRTGQLADDPTILNRTTGLLGHWMTFSGVELLVWCAVIPALPLLSRKWIGAFSIISIAIVLSNTRGVWLGALAGFAFVALALPRRVVAAVVILMAVLTLAASPFIYRRLSMSLDQKLETNYSRAVYLVVGARIVKDHPLFGVGPERIGREFKNYYTGPELGFYGHLHNNIMQIAAERGLLCLVTFLWLLVEFYRSLLRQLKKATERTRWVTLGSLAALTGFVVAGLTEYNFGDSEPVVLLLFLISIPFGFATHVQENSYSQSR